MMPTDDKTQEPAPDVAPAADLPVHARERLGQMRKSHFFTSDLSVNEFLLVKESGFEPLGLVMGSSVYHIQPRLPAGGSNVSQELEEMTTALYHSRELAMTRLEEEADALGADGIIGVRLEVNLHAWGKQVAEFMAVGTAVKHRDGGNYRNHKNRPFTSDLSGQDFWTLLKAGYRPVGFVMGNCVYFIGRNALAGWYGSADNGEVTQYTHDFYDARELAMERLQAEAEDLGATGVVGVTITDKQHSWRNQLGGTGVLGAFAGEILEFFVIGTAVVAVETTEPLPVPLLCVSAAP